MARAVPHVLTIAPGQDFAEIIVRALMGGRLFDLDFSADPARLADLVIYVPTQRVRRILEAAFAEALAPRPAILPRIRPLAEPGDPLDRIFATGEGGALGDPFMATTRTITPIARRFALLPLIERWRGHLRAALESPGHAPGAATSVRESLALAEALGRLIDEMRIAGVPLAKLESTAPPGYDPARFDTYWEKTRAFLRIAAEFWPNELAEMGARDEMDIRLDAIDAEAARLERDDPATPILVIGSTGSVAATARLMRAVARLDHGAVVLPGLDLELDTVGWDEIAAEDATLATRFAHPQAALKRTLAEIGIGRDDVPLLEPETPAETARNRMLSEALRPAESVDRWREAIEAIDLHAALEGLSVVDAADEREEALAVAILMRETLETPTADVAFVTADRALARRVAAELRRWDIDVEDSAGTSLAERPCGTLLRLFLRAAAERDGGSILALLRHPLVRLGHAAERLDALVDALELLVFRGRHFVPALSLADRARHALANPPSRPHDAAARVLTDIRDMLPAFSAGLDAAFAPFSPGAPAHTIADFAADLVETLAALTRDDLGASTLDADPDATLLIDMLAEISTHGQNCVLEPSALGGAFDIFLGERIVPPARAGDPRAAILGPLEARLVSASRMIVGGLNEGSFPPIAEEDPFLNRAMRLDLGLQPPERRIGQSAHDFAMLAGSREVILTRAARAGGQPAIPSRFLRRLEALAGKKRWDGVRTRGEATLHLARLLDEPGPYAPIAPPEPIPAAPRVPARLSITEIETLRRDPYAIYARHILKLAPLEPIEPALDARERGTLLHACLEAYAATEPPEDPELAALHLREIGARLFEPIRHERELFHFWWQRFLSIIPDFVAFDRARRKPGQRILTEARGRLAIELPTGDSVTISGKADRIEIDAAGALAILDYKSGTAPSTPTVERGLAPQLPITAAMALRGGFGQGLAGSTVAEIAHVTIGGNTPLDIAPIEPKSSSLSEVIAGNWQRLERELATFARGEIAYRARVSPAARDREGDYDHLARVREWSAAGGSDENGEAFESSAGEAGA